MAQSVASETKLKLLLLGNAGVGKTSLLLRFDHRPMPLNLMATIGMDFCDINTVVGGEHVRVRVFDTAGAEKFGALTNNYYRNVDGIFLVYDVTDIRSFEAIRSYHDSLLQMHVEIVPKVLIANKIDLRDKVQISEAMGEALAQSYGIPFFATSALDNDGIERAFLALVQTAHQAKVPVTDTSVYLDQSRNEALTPSESECGC